MKESTYEGKKKTQNGLKRNGCFMADCGAVTEIRDDFIRTFAECNEVTEKYKSGRSARLRIGQLFMRLFAELL